MRGSRVEFDKKDNSRLNNRFRKDGFVKNLVSNNIGSSYRLQAGDFAIMFFTTILVVFGIVMVFSASYYYSISREATPYAYLIKQGVYGCIGLVIMFGMSCIDYHVWQKFSTAILLVNIVLLLLIFTKMGITVNGATRWLKIGVSIIPGEIAKFSCILFVSSYFATDMKRAVQIKSIIPLMLIVGVVAGLIMKQPNLSTALTVLIITFGILFLAGFPWKYIFIAVPASIFILVFKVLSSDGYQRNRMLSFIDPFAQALGDGFQVVQSLLALGTGGVFGVGIGKSVQKTLYLPEPHTDFIMAIVGEELGLVGVILLLVVFSLLIYRIFIVSIKAPDNFGMLVAGGVGIMIGIQVIFNVAIVTSIMPPTGVAMPFISYGGNSLWIFMALIGIVLNISKHKAKYDI